MTNSEIFKKLDTIIALLATQGKEEKEKLKILKSLEFPYSEISKLLGVPIGTLKTWDFKKRKLKK
jgi:DNA-directed RNA polymerase specialized sigma24 family protein